MPIATPYFDWYLGLTLGFAVVVAVVVVVAAILTLAGQIGDQARTAVSGLEQVRDSTAPLWEIRATNASALAILAAAKAARDALVGSPLPAPPPAPKRGGRLPDLVESLPLPEPVLANNSGPTIPEPPVPAPVATNSKLPERKFKFIVRES